MGPFTADTKNSPIKLFSFHADQLDYPNPCLFPKGILQFRATPNGANLSGEDASNETKEAATM